MENFVTLNKSDPRFRPYLRGELPDRPADQGLLIPLPVRTLNLNHGNESVTFQIIRPVMRPRLWFLGLLRWELLPLTLFPVAAVFAKNYAQISLGTGGLWLGLFFFVIASLVFLHAGTFCWNDYLDHMGGLDRVSEKGGSHVIQKGWVTAWQVKLYGSIFLGLSLLFSLPIFYSRPEFAVLAAGVLGVMVLGYRFSRWGTPSALLGFCALFLIFGPLLTLSTDWLLLRGLSVQSAAMGCFMGLTTISYVHAKQMISMVVDQEAGLRTVAVQLGIDRAVFILRAILLFVTFVFTMILLAYLPIYNGFLGLIVLLPLIHIFKSLKHVRSPLSSKLQGVPRQILIFYVTAVLVYMTGLWL